MHLDFSAKMYWACISASSLLQLLMHLPLLHVPAFLGTCSSSPQLPAEDGEKVTQLQQRQAQEWRSLHTGFALEQLRLMLHTRARQGRNASASAGAAETGHQARKRHTTATTTGTNDSQSGQGPSHICFIIRTYWAHGATELGGSGSLGALLKGLVASPHTQ
jgi:hypothetical protein